MEPTLPLGYDVWDLDQPRLPGRAGWKSRDSETASQHRPGDPFIKGPVPHAWIASACRLPGAGLQVAMASRFLCCRFRSENRWGLDVIAEGLRISTRSARRGLHAAELAGLLAVEREPGCKLAVSVLDRPGAGGRAGASAVVWSDPLELVAPGLPAPGEVPPSCVGLLALGGLGPVGRFRAGVGRLGRVRPLPVLGLPGPGWVGAGRVGHRGPPSRAVYDRDN